MRDTNFFEPFIETKKSDYNQREIILFITVGIVLFCLITLPLVNKIRIYKMNREITKIDREINSTQNKIKKQSIEEKREDLSKLKTKQELLATITTDFSKKDNVGDFLVYSITDSMTSDMFLKSLEITEEQAIVTGISRDKESIAKLERSLRRISYFKKVFIPNITLEEEFYAFTINLSINNKEVKLKKEELEQDRENDIKSNELEEGVGENEAETE